MDGRVTPANSPGEPTRLLSRVAHMGTIAEAAAAALSAMTGSSSPSVAIVLWSGWTDAADVFGDAGADVTAEVSMADLPGLAPPSRLRLKSRWRIFLASPHRPLSAMRAPFVRCASK